MSQEEKERGAGGFGSAFLLLSGLCFGLAIPYSTATGYWFQIFVVIGLGFLIPGLLLASKPLKGIHERMRQSGIRIDNLEKQTLERQEALEKEIMERQNNFAKQVLESIEKLEKRGTYLEIEDLLRHLADIKLSLKTNNLLNDKRKLRNSDYNPIIEKIDLASKDIETRIHKTKIL